MCGCRPVCGSGAEGDGWRLAKVTLANERIGLSSGGVLWSNGPTARLLIVVIRRNGGVSDPVLRDRLAAIHCEAEVLRPASCARSAPGWRGAPQALRRRS